MTAHARNVTLLAAAHDIFGFRRGRSWSDLKQKISGDEIREFYKVHASLWTPQSDWASMLPEQKMGELRGLYLGDIRPDITLKNLIRFSLYSDQLLVVDPFHNAWTLRPEYDPIANPDQYKADTLKLLHFLFSVGPWIDTGVLCLIPDPGTLDASFKWETARLAKTRIGDREINQADLDAGYETGRADLMRVILALPEDQLIACIEGAGSKLSEEEKRNILSYARQKLRNDPIALEQPPGDNKTTGQITALRSGANLETALLLCNVFGAFPYTNMMSKWEEIVGARDALNETARVWSPLTKAFQDLDFRFLNDVDPKFIQRIRDEGRFESFRSLLRRVGKEAAQVSSLSTLDSFVRDCKDELMSEYQNARSEWSKIDESFLKWAGSSVAGSVVTGHLVPDIAAWSAGTINVIAQLGVRYLRHQQFRKSNPMSVFIDLDHK